ncbi:hypothetical protein N431DRAFT_545669 [Stipitochalara longipes BDJ]|nr:hypothetical protein N431DRAFT_545669 [Stipitochalara longipes BDJ]
MSLSLALRCPVCSSTEHLRKCQGCKVQVYCDREHQVSDRDAHMKACNGVKKAQQTLDIEEQKLRDHPGDFLTPPNLFEEGVGHFWGIHETRPYMRARYALIETLLKIKTSYAVQSALTHALDMLRLCRSDNIGVRDCIPGMFLRLGKDQECYDFIKWYSTTGEDSHYDWGDMDLPFLDVKDADAFESIELYTREYADLGFSVAVALIKFRLLLDIKALQNSTVLGEKVPQELLDNIRGQLVSSIVAGNKDIMRSEDQTALIKQLESQVEELYKAVDKSNKYFWPALLQPGKHLTARPQAYSTGTAEHMQLALQFSYAAWVETPGAIDMIKELSEKHSSN